MERDVSIASASQVVGALRSRGHDVIAYDSGRGRLTAADEQRLFSGKIDRRPPDKHAVSSLPTVVSAPDLAHTAALHGRDYVIPDDIKALAEPTLAHRVIVNPAARIKNVDSRVVIGDVLATIPVPGAQPAESAPRGWGRRGART